MAHFLHTGMGFMASKALLLATKMELFTVLNKHPEGLTWKQLGSKLGLKVDEDFRGTRDFLDLLVALKCLGRKGDGPDGLYVNTPEGDAMLVKGKPAYVGGLLEMSNNRLYQFWNNLEDALRTGEAQNEMKRGEEDLFASLKNDETRLEEFAKAMTGGSLGAFQAFAQKFDFSPYQTAIDLGGSLGTLTICVAQDNKHITATTYDLPELLPLAEKNIAEHGLSNRVKADSCNFFEAEAFPAADVILMGQILHDWGLPQKLELMQKAHKALPPGGAFVAIDRVIDDERRTFVPGLTMSLNMLIETGKIGGFDYTFQEFLEWARQVGFARTQKIDLGPASACVAFKD